MGYNNSNAAVAYDMNAAPAYREAPTTGAPAVRQTPRFDVYKGAGREANQEVSPVFVKVLAVCLALVAAFFVIGIARVTLAGMTASVLNDNAEMADTLEKETDESSDLEVMNSVYGADTRIRDLAGTYGMTEPEDSVTLDFSQDAAATGASSASSAQ